MKGKIIMEVTRNRKKTGFYLNFKQDRLKKHYLRMQDMLLIEG